ncbi:MAG: YibE/F family protein [bacterium]
MLFLISGAAPVLAQEKAVPPQAETLEAVIVGVLEEREIQSEYTKEKQLYQKLELLVTKGSLKDEKITVENGSLPIVNLQKYQKGDKVVVSYSAGVEGNSFFYITDYVRRGTLLWLFIIFVVLVAVVAGWRGMASLVGMGASFLVIFKFILPKILAGSDPIQIAIVGSLAIIPVTFYLSHGFNKKTTVAVAGTVISLIITGILAGVFVEKARLTGFASEEAGFLQAAKQGTVNMRGLLLAGIIIGVLGVLDDITVSQSAVVTQLKKANPKLGFGKLYRQAMNVGQDHISSMVNTLVLVYTGAALPLFLLFVNNPHPFSEVVSYEMVADEIVRTLVGSIGLVLAVPITTLIAVLVAETDF